jgi:16S rRNA (uracil1498-N3)-methyltransferase
LDRVCLPGAVVVDGRVTIDGSARRHLTDSLRLRPGGRFLATDGNGLELLLEIESSDRRALVAGVRDERRRPPGPGRAVAVAIAPPKGTRMETAIEKTTEIGVGGILPMRTRRSVVKGRRDSERSERWSRVAASATAQSGRFHAPALAPVRSFEDVLADRAGAGRLLLAHPDPGAVSPETALAGVVAGDPVTWLIGPEGGFDEEEVGRALAAGAVAVTLGRNRLRTETAAIVAVARTIAAVDRAVEAG